MKGAVLLTLSALFFALATIAARHLLQTSDIPVLEITFFRFFLGLVAVAAIMVSGKISPRANNYRLVIFRGVFNTIAVFFFFGALAYTTVAHANLLNMTYPVFVIALAPFLNHEKNSGAIYLYLVMTMAGVFLVMAPLGGPGPGDINLGDILGIISGLLAALAITSLREARKYDSSITILFYLMTIGTVMNALFIPRFVVPDAREALLIAAASILGVAGQFLITEGFRTASAAVGSLLSVSRIPFAIAAGMMFLGETVTLRTVAGSLLIIISLVGTSGIFGKMAGGVKTRLG